MKIKLKSMIAGLLCTSIILSGCGKSSKVESINSKGESKNVANVNPAGQMPIVKEKINLSAFIVQDSALVSDLVNNDATIELEKRTNIHLNFIAAPLDSYKEKQRLLLASGDYPDIFLGSEIQGFNNEDIMLYGANQKVLIPINKLIEKYGIEVKKQMAKVKSFKSDITTLDGNIYGVPSIDQAYHVDFFQKAWINQEWLNKLNLKMPETTDDLYNVLKAFKEKDPNGNGKQDEIPLTGAINWENGQPQDFIMNAFIYTNRKNYFNVDNGKVGYSPSSPDWREGLKFMNKLYKDGLLDPGAFTQTMAQVKQLGTKADGTVLGMVTTGHPGHFTVISDDPKNAVHTNYVAVPPLKGPKGAQYATDFAGIQGAGFAITDKCKDPEAAFRLADYLYSEEGTLLITEGLEGKMWEKAKDGQKDIMGRPAEYSRIVYSLLGGAKNFNWGNTMFRNRGSELDGLRGKWATDQNTMTQNGYEKRLFDETKNKYDGKQPKEYFDNVFISADTTEEALQLKVNIEDYVKQSEVRFITGNMDIEKDWDTYLKKLNDLKLNRYLEIYGKAYQDKLKNK